MTQIIVFKHWLKLKIGFNDKLNKKVHENC